SVFNIIELKKGGILQLKKDRVHTIEKQTNSNNTKGLRWNGIAIFDHNLNKQLEIFLKKYGDTPQEDFFQHLIENGHKIYTETVADFINNNSPESLLVTSLYNASENYFDKDTELSKNLTNVAQQLRNKLLKE
ncbi:MAG: hypothetical protein U9Q67_03475, partial [Patescibacteria group bacterium]|nr:hypothetical protein [Patescibacteria group bacterium]